MSNGAPAVIHMVRANRRVRRLLDASAAAGLPVTASASTHDCWTVTLDTAGGRVKLNVYGEGGNAAEVYLVDDDRGDYDQITQTRALALIAEAGQAVASSKPHQVTLVAPHYDQLPYADVAHPDGCSGAVEECPVEAYLELTDPERLAVEGFGANEAPGKLVDGTTRWITVHAHGHYHPQWNEYDVDYDTTWTDQPYGA